MDHSAAGSRSICGAVRRGVLDRGAPVRRRTAASGRTAQAGGFQADQQADRPLFKRVPEREAGGVRAGPHSRGDRFADPRLRQRRAAEDVRRRQRRQDEELRRAFREWTVRDSFAGPDRADLAAGRRHHGGHERAAGAGRRRTHDRYYADQSRFDRAASRSKRRGTWRSTGCSTAA